ncbi:MAG TPA: TIGR03067 domain-containing protein [Gemmataceae bacterium]|nr:TIGR03067 domain-containing protein [Gemmataceae bacterium]
MRISLLALFVCIPIGFAWADDAANKEMKLLDGEWAMVSGEREGTPFSEEVVKAAKRVTKDGETATEFNGVLAVKAKFKVDASKNPKTIDYDITDGPNKGKGMIGIYEIKGDEFKACMVMSDQKRPTDFTTKEGDGRTLTVWKRVKTEK